MPIELYLAFVGASALLVLSPGPMVAYLIATTLSHGLRHGLMGLIGSAAASAVQLAMSNGNHVGNGESGNIRVGPTGRNHRTH